MGRGRRVVVTGIGLICPTGIGTENAFGKGVFILVRDQGPEFDPNAHRFEQSCHLFVPSSLGRGKERCSK
jgi:hypothetical protein